MPSYKYGGRQFQIAANLATASTAANSTVGAFEYLPAAAAQGVIDFAGETMKIIAQRRAEPRDDLISLWCQSEVDGRPWTDQEVISETILVLDGGAETTRTVIGSMIYELARRPDQKKIVVDRLS